MPQFTVNIADDVARQAHRLAALEGRAVEDYMAGIVELEIAADSHDEATLLASFSDDDVLALADLRMPEQDDHRLHELLDLNSEGQLSSAQEIELAELMRQYDEGMLKKAMGWAEAVRRKLRKPIQT